MNDNLSNLAVYLNGLYKGVYINDEAMAELNKAEYRTDISRFEVIMNIDLILGSLNPNGEGKKITKISVERLDNARFGVKFSVEAQNTEPDSQEVKSNKDKIKDLLSLISGSDNFKVIDAGTISLPSDENSDEGEGISIEEELAIVREAVNIIQQIEQHQASITTISTTKSALIKYIPQIEANYLKPYLEAE